MLIKTTEGHVYNLDHAYKLHIGRPTSATLAKLGHGYRQTVQGDEFFVVQAHFAAEEIDLTEPSSQDEAQRTLNRIFLHYPNNLDLNECP